MHHTNFPVERGSYPELVWAARQLNAIRDAGIWSDFYEALWYRVNAARKQDFGRRYTRGLQRYESVNLLTRLFGVDREEAEQAVFDADSTSERQVTLACLAEFGKLAAQPRRARA